MMSRAVLLAAALLAGVLRSRAGAQDPLQEGAAGPAPAGNPTPATEIADVYVNDSLEAADALAKTAELAKRGRWPEAAETVHRIAESAGDKLVQVGEKDTFVSVRLAVAQVVASWPEPGRAAYRALAEPAMLAMLRRHAETRRIEPFLVLFEKYFATSTAAVLADRIAQSAIESGEFALAEAVYDRVLREHPDAERYRETYGAILSVLAAMQGKPARPPPAANASVRWQGHDQPLGEVLQAVRRSFSVDAPAGASQTWPIFGGEPTRSQVSGPTIAEPGLLWRASLGRGDHAEPADPAQRDWSEPAGSNGTQAAAFPVVGDGRVYVQHGRQIVALHLGSGAVAWRFEAGSVAEAADTYPDDRPPDAISPTFAVGRVLASIPAEEPVFYQYDPGRRGAELLCLDAADGRLLWRVDARALQLKPGELALDTSPIVAHESVYVIARRRRTFGFEDSYLCRFRLEDGSLAYRVHLGSASTGAYTQRAAVAPALHNGIVYACSGLGSVLAVSAYSGEVKWARRYARSSVADGLAVSPTPVSRVVLNPLLRWDHRIVVLPPDGDALLVLDAASGSIVDQFPRGEWPGADTLLGIRGSLLCGLGDRVFCFDLSARSARMQSDLPPKTELSGRAVWAGDEMLAPTTSGLLRYAISGGKPTEQPWDGAGRGGNLLALPDRLIVAEPDGVAAYVLKANIWKSLRERMAAAPSDPLPAVELAEVAMGAGEHLEAIDVLREAQARLAQSPSEHAPLRRRMFADVLKLAAMLVARGEANAVELQTLCDDAGEYAADAAASVDYRLQFARLFERIDRPTAAVRLYQQILLDRTLRTVETMESGTPLPAAASAARRIAGLIAEHGDDVFAEYEAEAALWLANAEQTGDEDSFRRVIESFPNASATGRAFVAYADLLASGGRLSEARRLYVRAYGRYGGRIDRVPLAAKLIDTLIRLKKPESAWRWLQKAERDVPRGDWMNGDAQTAMESLRRRVEGMRASAEPTLPRVTPPLEAKPPLDLEPGARLLVPRMPHAGEMDWERFYVRTSEGVAAYDAATAQRTWFALTKQQKDADLLLARKDLAVLATLYEVFALDASTGAVVWKLGRKPEHAGDPGGDWEQGGALRTHALQDDVLVSQRDNGEITAAAISSGDTLWQQTYRPAAFGRISIADPWVIYHVTLDGRTRICILDADTGTWLGDIVADESRPLEDLFATIDGKAIVITSRAVSAYCLHTRAKLWSVAISGQVRPGSLVVGPSEVYFSENGLDVQKIELTSGTVAWQSQRVADRGVDDLTVQFAGDSLLVSTPSSLVAIDVHSGLRQWEATLPARPRLDYRLLTQSFVLAIDTSGEVREEASAAYFFDHAQTTGLIPPGGGVDLGRMAKIRAVLALDHGLLIETDQQIRLWLR